LSSAFSSITSSALFSSVSPFSRNSLTQSRSTQSSIPSISIILSSDHLTDRPYQSISPIGPLYVLHHWPSAQKAEGQSHYAMTYFAWKLLTILWPVIKLALKILLWFRLILIILWLTKKQARSFENSIEINNIGQLGFISWTRFSSRGFDPRCPLHYFLLSLEKPAKSPSSLLVVVYRF